jgi:hypothetical protein
LMRVTDRNILKESTSKAGRKQVFI